MNDLNKHVTELYKAFVPGGLQEETSQRHIRALSEILSGYEENPESHVKIFESSTDSMVVVRRISLVSVCEHHLLPFWGWASIGYLPRGGRILGLSKFSRIVRCFSRRLNTQEKLTEAVAGFLHDRLNPLGVGVVTHATHSCAALRGIEDGGMEMTVSCMKGVFRDSQDTRSEFLKMAGV